jgi:hypothetical protein
MASEELASAPSPKPKAIGMSPQIVVREVIKIGLRACPSGLDDRFSEFNPLFPKVIDIIDQDDRIAHNDSDHHDDSDPLVLAVTWTIRC